MVFLHSFLYLDWLSSPTNLPFSSSEINGVAMNFSFFPCYFVIFGLWSGVLGFCPPLYYSFLSNHK